MITLETWSYGADYVKAPRWVIRLLQRKPAWLAVYFELLSRARYQAGPAFTKQGAVVDLDIGQAVCGRDELAKTCGLPVEKTRIAIRNLEKLQILTTKATSAGTVVTLCRYKETYPFVAEEHPARQPTDTQPAPSGHPADTQPAPTNKKCRDDKTTRDVKTERASRTRKLPLPLTWLPNEEAKSKAKSLGLDVEYQAERFKLYSRQKGWTFAQPDGPDAGFELWLTNGNARAAKGATNGTHGRVEPHQPGDYPDGDCTKDL